MKEEYIAVGDIHGCLAELNEVLTGCASYKDHRYVFLGDYIDRGPSSDEVIDLVRSLDAVCLIGNHEQSLLRYLEVHEGRLDPTPENRIPVISAENREWIRSTLRKYYETGSYLFVHAGFDPQKDLAQQGDSDMLWTRYDGSYRGLTDKLVVHGHTRVADLEQFENRININTGCGFGGPLTAYILPERIAVQSRPSQKYSRSSLEDLRQDLLMLDGVEAELEDV